MFLDHVTANGYMTVLLIYATIISDRYCKNYSSVVKVKPYGDVSIVKEDCVGHADMNGTTAQGP